MVSRLRIGIGQDLHRIRAGGRLVLAGEVVSDSMSAVAHSDGDVVLHALVDAILGALGLGDIGEHFRNDDPRWRGADSRVFVEHAMRLLAERGGHVVNVDVTILAERPKLSSMKQAMADCLRELIGCPNVNVKAGTNEGCDAVGRGEAIAATVAVLLDCGGSL
jgi:2-C-methyl-D-erythritol 2,4-cyclodiphosphate synthase